MIFNTPDITKEIQTKVNNQIKEHLPVTAIKPITRKYLKLYEYYLKYMTYRLHTKNLSYSTKIATKRHHKNKKKYKKSHTHNL